MNKVFLCIFISAFMCLKLFAIDIDEASVKVHFVGFKTEKRISVAGVIEQAEFKFGANSGDIKKILEGTTASMDFINENTKDKIRERNIARTFIDKLKNSKITAILKDVKGNNFNGKAIATITFNNITQDIPMDYELKNGKLIVKGIINMNKDFDLIESYTMLSRDKQISALHGKKTHEDVEIYFDVDVK